MINKNGMKRHLLLSTLACLILGGFSPIFAMRIISLAPSLTKNLQYLGAENEMVGCTNYCKVTRKMPIVATAIKVDIEKVVSLRPDLVVTSTLTTPETIAILKKMRIKVVSFPMCHSYKEVCDQFVQLGKLVGKEVQARKVLASTNKTINSVKTKQMTNQKIFFQLGINPIFSVIPNTFMEDYITFCGATNIAYGMKGGTMTREAVLARNPDAIFIVTMGSFAEQEKKIWEKYSNLSAMKRRKIFIIDSDKACTPTPVTFAETLVTMVKLLK